MANSAKKSSDDKRIPARSIRVTDEEWAVWAAAADADGLKIAAWLRLLARREIARKKRLEK
jgi:hypothetical protein